MTIPFRSSFFTATHCFVRIFANFLTAIAGKLGNGATPKAVTHIIAKVKSGELLNTNMEISTGDAGSASKSGSGRARKPAGPAKKAGAKVTPKKTRNYEDDDEDDDEDMLAIDGSDDEADTFTPSNKPKAPLNRVQTGRVTKPRKTAPAPGA